MAKKATLAELVSKWPKYTAINLCRMYPYPFGSGPGDGAPALGTIEFRHLGGTDDVLRVLTWKSLILKLFRASVAMDQKDLIECIMSMRSPGQYSQLLADVFGEETADQFQIQDVKSLFGGTIARAKGLFIDVPKLGPIKDKSALAVCATKLAGKIVKKPVKRKKVTNSVTLDIEAADNNLTPHWTTSA
jgi:hypothetical protein